MSTQIAVSLAKKALEIAWDGSLPVRPEVIATKLSVVMPGSTTGEKKRIPVVVRGSSPFELPVSGQASYVEIDGQPPYFLCEYNNFEPDYRNRFTAAHELGHVFLGHVVDGKKPKRDTDFKTNNFDPDEIAANAFAAELIMPADEVTRLFNAAKGISELSNAFGVSTAAMRFRLKNLGLIQ